MTQQEKIKNDILARIELTAHHNDNETVKVHVELDGDIYPLLRACLSRNDKFSDALLVAVRDHVRELKEYDN